jgi:hypothetical protein
MEKKQELEQLELFPQEQTIIENKESNTIEDVEWCFQFFNNEPVVFAYSNEGEAAVALNLIIQPKTDDGLTFQQNGMTFKVFPRPITEETKLERTKENQQ